jgi:hypothetical protein
MTPWGFQNGFGLGKKKMQSLKEVEAVLVLIKWASMGFRD